MVDTIIIRVHGANQHKKGIINKMIAENTKTSLHIVPEHNALFHKLHTLKKDGFSTTKILTQDKILHNNDDINDVLSNETSNQINEHYVSTNKIRYQSAEYVKERTAKLYGKYNIRSSESDVTFSINYEGGFIDFNFSIPKYLYGHNMAQFIPQCESPLFFKNSSTIFNWNTQKLLLFNRLNNFVYFFLKDLFINLELEYQPVMTYVELVRIDLCYNQYFDSKEIALAYLNEQKKLKKKSKVYSPDLNTDFITTLAWRTQNGCYFKIYHKGTEYINTKFGDFKKHNEINKKFLDEYFKMKQQHYSNDFPFWKTTDTEKANRLTNALVKRSKQIKAILKKSVTGETFHISDEELLEMRDSLLLSEKLQPIDTYFLKTEMDKILRYEVSVSGKYLSYQFKNYVFRKDCQIHQNAKRIYKKVKRHLESPQRFEKKVPRFHMNLYDMFHKWYNKSNSVVFTNSSLIKRHRKKACFDFNKQENEYNISDSFKEFGLGTLLETRSVSDFNQTFLIHLVDNFKKLIDDFQIEQLEPFDDLQKRVQRFNEEVEKNYTSYNFYNNKKKIVDVSLLDAKRYKRYIKLLNKTKKEYIKYSDLLTEKEKQEKGLQKISYSNMIRFFTLMTDEHLSAFEASNKLGLSKSQYYRIVKNLKLLGISEKQTKMIIPVKPKLDFFTYYSKTSGYNYKKKFYLKPEHSKLN